MTYRDDEDHAQETGAVRRFLRGMIRRVAVTLADSTASWQLRGVRSPTSGDEVFQAELFPGIGIFARPPSSGAPEAIALAVGGAKATVVVATRDEATRRLIASQVEAGDTAIYNGALIVILKATGTIELRTHAGVALALATKADLDALRTYVNNQFYTAGGHTHVVAGAATTTITAATGPGATPPTTLAPTSLGTTKVRGE